MESLDRIDALIETLEKELEVYNDLVTRKTKAEATYKSLRAKLYLASKLEDGLKTVPEKESWVDDQLESEYFDFRLAEGILEAHKERIRTLRAMLSALQTLASAGRI